MIAVLVILAFAVYLSFFFPLEAKAKKEDEKSPKYKAQMKKLWQVAQTSMKERKPFRAEKALLTILKFDEKNAAAYNRLGILYAKGQRYEEAVECFEIAQSLDNNPASIHNVGLIYLETGAYEKAEMAFLQAISLEGDVPARYMALAKAEEKLGNYRKAVEALESAYELDPSVATLRQILAIYEATGDTEAATATTARIEEQITKDSAAKRKRAVRMVRKPAVKAAKVLPDRSTRADGAGKIATDNAKKSERTLDGRGVKKDGLGLKVRGARERAARAKVIRKRI
ncbi:tetratricopeptide repeat protein [Candidatus Saccharibacteria bacterium]|nr:tetratricopeptide repeat protein [Candidatus Saccharibacteria bacterium]